MMSQQSASFAATTPSRQPDHTPLNSPASSFTSASPICNYAGSNSTDDSSSILSSASATANNQFKVPDTWRPSIMGCIQAQTEESRQQRQLLEMRLSGT